MLSDSKVSDSARRGECISADKERYDLGSGPTPSIPELASIVAAWSPAKPCEEEGEDSAAYRELQELLDKPTPSGSKESLKTSSKPNPKVGMKAKRVKEAGSKSRIGNLRSYTNDEMIECQEKLYDSDDFQFSIDDVEKEF